MSIYFVLDKKKNRGKKTPLQNKWKLNIVSLNMLTWHFNLFLKTTFVQKRYFAFQIYYLK